MMLFQIQSRPILNRTKSPMNKRFTFGIFLFNILLVTCLHKIQAKTTLAPDLNLKPWQNFLTKYIDTTGADGLNRLNYKTVTKEDKKSLEDFLLQAQDLPISKFPSEKQRATWINIYNVQTVIAVLDHFPIKSIRDIQKPNTSGKSLSAWDIPLLKIEGQSLTLNNIENDILRKKWADPRIHFALNCASIGCPNLSATVFTAENLNTKLESGARKFLNSKRAQNFSNGKLMLSSLFDWYKTDFGGTDSSVLTFISKFNTTENAAQLQAYSGKIEYQYDWNLNSK